MGQGMWMWQEKVFVFFNVNQVSIHFFLPLSLSLSLSLKFVHRVFLYIIYQNLLIIDRMGIFKVTFIKTFPIKTWGLFSRLIQKFDHPKSRCQQLTFKSELTQQLVFNSSILQLLCCQISRSCFNLLEQNVVVRKQMMGPGCWRSHQGLDQSRIQMHPCKRSSVLFLALLFSLEPKCFHSLGFGLLSRFAFSVCFLGLL